MKQNILQKNMVLLLITTRCPLLVILVYNTFCLISVLLFISVKFHKHIYLNDFYNSNWKRLIKTQLNTVSYSEITEQVYDVHERFSNPIKKFFDLYKLFFSYIVFPAIS